MLIKVKNLPIQITKSDLDELFSPYGEIQITEIKIENDHSIAFVELESEENGQRAIDKLHKTRWRGNILYLNRIRGNGNSHGQHGNRDTDSDNTGNR